MFESTISTRWLYKFIIIAVTGYCCLVLIISDNNTDIIVRGRGKRPAENVSDDKFLFCIILTSPHNLQTSRPYTILNVWASKCSDYRFISVIPDNVRQELKKSNLSENFVGKALKILQPEGHNEEKYSNLTFKVLHSFRDVYKNHSGYKWYLKADDDTFVHVDNAIQFLKTQNPQLPLTLGRDLNYTLLYPSGGAGYFMSNTAFNLLGEKLTKNINFCSPGFGIEDYDIGRCFKKLGVYTGNTTDEFGRERFNVFNIHSHYVGNYPSWYYQRIAKPVPGIACCADDFISFHYMSPEDMLRLDTVIQRQERMNKQHNRGKPTFKSIVEEYIYLEKVEKMFKSTPPVPKK